MSMYYFAITNTVIFIKNVVRAVNTSFKLEKNTVSNKLKHKLCFARLL